MKSFHLPLLNLFLFDSLLLCRHNLALNPIILLNDELLPISPRLTSRYPSSMCPALANLQQEHEKPPCSRGCQWPSRGALGCAEGPPGLLLCRRLLPPRHPWKGNKKCAPTFCSHIEVPSNISFAKKTKPKAKQKTSAAKCFLEKKPLTRTILSALL